MEHIRKVVSYFSGESQRVLQKAFSPQDPTAHNPLAGGSRLRGTLVSHIMNGSNIDAAKELEPLLANTGLPVGKLHYIALAGSTLDTDGVRSANILKKGFENATPLHYACINPDATILRKFLSVDPALAETKDGYNRTGLHYAAMSTTDAAVRAILELHSSVHISALSNEKVTPARTACRLGRAANLKLLLAHRDTDAQIMHRLDDKQTLFLDAIIGGSIECVKVVFEAASEPLRKSSSTSSGERSLYKRLASLKSLIPAR